LNPDRERGLGRHSLGYRAALAVIGRSKPSLAVVTALCAALTLGACGGDLDKNSVEQQVSEKGGEGEPLGFPLLATKNTTRVAGEDAVEDAAAVASAVYPGFDAQQRPQAVTLVDKHDWRAAIAAAVLMAPPIRAPILLTDGADLPDATDHALDRLRPSGTPLAGRAQAFEIGDARAGGLRRISVPSKDPFELASAVEALAFRLTGQRPSDVVVTSAADSRYAMPAAAWAAKSGDPVLFTNKDNLPAATRKAIARRDEPAIYVLGPRSVIGDGVLRRLKSLGRVRRIAGRDPVENAIAFARFADGDFGWGVRDPGHGLSIANVERPLDAAAAAALAASGSYAPLVVTDSADALPPSLRGYLLDIQPGYQTDPVRGVYNHAWLLGDESAIGGAVQGKIDELTEIVKVRLGEPQ
jgi:hypothetical protein